MEQKLILVVEDDRDIRENVAEFLESEGYSVMSASNGKEALTLLSTLTELPRVILLDLMMPVMDGFKFKEEQEKDAKISAIPVVVMTADGQIEAKRAKMKAHSFIKKPIDIEAMTVLLKQFFV